MLCFLSKLIWTYWICNSKVCYKYHFFLFKNRIINNEDVDIRARIILNIGLNNVLITAGTQLPRLSFIFPLFYLFIPCISSFMPHYIFPILPHCITSLSPILLCIPSVCKPKTTHILEPDVPWAHLQHLSAGSRGIISAVHSRVFSPYACFMLYTPS